MVSKSKSDLRDNLTSMVLVPLNRPHAISYGPFVVAMYLSCTVSEIVSVIFQN